MESPAKKTKTDTQKENTDLDNEEDLFNMLEDDEDPEWDDQEPEEERPLSDAFNRYLNTYNGLVFVQFWYL